MKKRLARLYYVCMPLVMLALCGCDLHAVSKENYIGAQESTPVPAVTLIETPAPTATPRVESFDMERSLFRRDGIIANVINITYTQNRRVDASLTVQNLSGKPLTFYARVPGAVNGWAVIFHIEDMGEDDIVDILAGETVTLHLYTEFEEKTAVEMGLTHLHSIDLSLNGMLGEKGFVPVGNTIINNACDPAYIPYYGDETRLIYQSERVKYYYHAYDPVTATLYLSAQTQKEAFDVLSVARVDGYAHGENGAAGCFTDKGKHLMLAVPLLETLRTFALNSPGELQLSVLLSQKGKPVAADVFNVPINEQDMQNWQMEQAATDVRTEAPDYIGTGLTFYGSDEIYIRHEGIETVPDAYYGTVTSYTLVCMNDTDAVLCPSALKILLAGAEVEGGFTGFIPPHSQTQLQFYINAHVPVGPEIGVEMQLLDAAHKMRRTVLENITFLSYE